MGRSLPLVYATPGNHEAHPTNAFSPQTVAPDTNTWVYSLLSDTWSHWIGSSAAASVSDLGTYSALVPDTNLRIISLNTNMWYVQNYWLYQRDMPADPDGQIAWLASELDGAEQRGERAYVIGHMAPGDHDALHAQSNYLDQVFDRYGETVAGMFFGHTHLDEVQINYADNDNPSAAGARAVSYIAPSLTPTSGHPSFRVYTVDPETFAVLDAETWIADMADPSFQETPTWTKALLGKGSLRPPPLPRGRALPRSLAQHHRLPRLLPGPPDLVPLPQVPRLGGRRLRRRVPRRRGLQDARGPRGEQLPRPEPGVRFRKRSGGGKGAGGRLRVVGR